MVQVKGALTLRLESLRNSHVPFPLQPHPPERRYSQTGNNHVTVGIRCPGIYRGQSLIAVLLSAVRFCLDIELRHLHMANARCGVTLPVQSAQRAWAANTWSNFR